LLFVPFAVCTFLIIGERVQIERGAAPPHVSNLLDHPPHTRFLE